MFIIIKHIIMSIIIYSSATEAVPHEARGRRPARGRGS